MASAVQTPRDFLTSLIDSLAAIPAPAAATSRTVSASGAGGERAPGGNPLKHVPAACRPLLTTLYAVYPLTLLPALDLLDRGLATRIFVSPPHSDPSPPDSREDTGTTQQIAAGAERGAETSDIDLVPGHDAVKENQTAEEAQREVSTGSSSSLPNNTNNPNPSPSPNPSFYIVRSAQPARRHGGGSKTSATSPPGPRYVVRLAAWNCTCAAFAFAAFPREDRRQETSSYVIDRPGPRPASSRPRGGAAGAGAGGGVEEGKWQFGALSHDGREGSGMAGVPCCKHLLACVLAERWKDVLGGYVEERVVGREECAGLVADI
ncbi:hypothetical protein F4819DRAFT_483605 [Hypoxylon fuscum]|nr:hypothetical protein F4819DRAFT_483605 [Hypoxylon fuscum]